MPNWVKNVVTLTGDEKQISKLIENIKSEDNVFDFDKIKHMPESLNVDDGSIIDDAVSVYMTAVNPDARHVGLQKFTKEDFKELVKKLEEASFYNHFDFNMTPAAVLDAVKRNKNCDSGTRDYTDLLIQGETYVSNAINYGCMTWYNWHRKYWGTKWNCCEDSYVGNNVYVFQTAWSMPDGIYRELSKQYPGVKVSVEYADEDIGANCGVVEYENGEVTYDEYRGCEDSEDEDARESACEFANSVWDY